MRALLIQLKCQVTSRLRAHGLTLLQLLLLLGWHKTFLLWLLAEVLRRAFYLSTRKRNVNSFLILTRSYKTSNIWSDARSLLTISRKWQSYPDLITSQMKRENGVVNGIMTFITEVDLNICRARDTPATLLANRLTYIRSQW